MSDLERIAALVMLVASGIWAGIILCYAVERVNLWQRMPITQYAVDFKRSIPRVDPLQPILAILAIIGATVFALNAGGTASLLGWIGVVLVAGVIVFSIALPERINSQFRKRPEGDAPADAVTLRSRWRLYHYVRTVPTLGAFALLVLATTFI